MGVRKKIISAEEADAIEYLAHELMRKCDSLAIARYIFDGTAAGIAQGEKR